MQLVYSYTTIKSSDGPEITQNSTAQRYAQDFQYSVPLSTGRILLPTHQIMMNGWHLHVSVPSKNATID